MRRCRLFWLRIALGVLITQSEATNGSDITRSFGMLDGTGIERGVTRVLCAEEGSQGWRRTRAMIVDTGESDAIHEILLAPAHGLPTDSDRIKKDCMIAAAYGSTEQIVDVWLPENRAVSGAGDWAVLMTRGRIQGDIRRLRAAALSPDTLARMVIDETSITLLLHSDSADQDDCALLNNRLQLQIQLQSGVFLHTCRTWPGVSGAPIVAGIDGKPIVIGFTIASRVRPLRYEGPLYIGVGRAIDEQIVSALRRASELARMPDKGNHRARARER